MHVSDGNEELASPDFGLFFEDTPEKMSHTQQANKRYYCERLTWLVNISFFLLILLLIITCSLILRLPLHRHLEIKA